MTLKLTLLRTIQTPSVIFESSNERKSTQINSNQPKSEEEKLLTCDFSKAKAKPKKQKPKNKNTKCCPT